jgi:tetratricopeptide (TPR) repeat protein
MGLTVPSSAEAVEILSGVVTDEVSASPFLGAAQRTLAEALRVTGRHDEAIAAAVEAVNIFSDLAVADPIAHRPFLGEAQRYLARALMSAGRNDQAIAMATKAVKVFSDLADADPATYLLLLGEAQLNLATALQETGQRDEATADQRDEAVAAATAAVKTLSVHAEYDPTASRLLLGRARRGNWLKSRTG